MLRRVLFWSHLCAGVAAGLFILLMSATGVLLTYERQIVSAAERSVRIEHPDNQMRLSADDLVEAVPGEGSLTLVFANAPDAPVRAERGRDDIRLLDPSTGEELASGAAGVRDFFGFVTALHRWLALDGAGRDAGRAINDAANLVFLFTIISGVYLWLPKVWNAATLRVRVWFGLRHPTAKARDYNWHHAFGLWAAIPLFVIVLTGVVFSYPWANRAVFAVFGETPPARGGPPVAGGDGRAARSGDESAAPSADQPAPGALELVLANAKTYRADWTTISLAAPAAPGGDVRVIVDGGTGGEPTERTTLVYADSSTDIPRVETFANQTPGRQTRSFIRFLHTGEALGVIGQTIAGLASLAACLMVWTGLALAYRRLIAPMWRTKSL